MFALVTKYGVAVSLAAVACFSGFADVPCTKSEPYQKNGKWYIRITCSGTVQTETEVELEGDGGSCTNCTKMTPQECEEYKAHLISESDSILERARGINQYSTLVSSEIQQAISVLNMIQTEGDTFNYFAKASELTYPSDSSISYVKNFRNFQAQPTGQYQFYSQFESSVGSYQVWGGNNSIYNYYNDGVKPLLDNATPHLMNANTLSQQIQSESAYLISEVGAVRDYVSAIPCLACSGGSGGGGDSGGGGSSGGCPCEELLNSIIALLEEKRDILKDWNDNQLPKLKQRLDKWQSMLKVIQDAVAPIGTNFVQAVDFIDRDDQSFTFPEKHKLIWESGEFDFGEYAKFSWFSRIEYLMLDFAGAFSKSNDVSDVDKAIEKANKSLEGNSSKESSITNSLDRLSSSSFLSIQTALSSMFQQFSFFGSGNSSISGAVMVSGDLSGLIAGLDSVSVKAFSGNSELIQITDRLVSFVRYGFQIIYAAVFLFLAYLLVVFLYGRISKLIVWLCSFYASVFGS